jgi:hypothetical protein
MRMASEAHMSILPFYCHVFSLNGGDLAAIGLIAVKANAAADFEGLGLFRRHSVGCPKAPRRELDLPIW